MRFASLSFCAPLALAVGLAGCASTGTTPSAGAGAAAQAAQAAAPPWAHQASDVSPDTNVRFGTLPNGMRYALMRNATPPGAAALRLRFDAGSMHERGDQRGIAHFIEHLTLNETRNVPEGELIRILERAGLSFGPDTNASTGFEQTIYMLDLPRTDEPTVDTALMLMREVAGEATLRSEVIERERGIILSEERSRAVPALRLAQDELAYLFTNDLLATRLPIGSTEVIRTATRDRFVDFYDGYYRPERATLIAVGDFDLDALEAKIRARFANWQGRGTPAPDVPPLQVPQRAVETRVFSEPGLPNRVTISWVAPRDNNPDSRARRIERIRSDLGMAIINRRLERLATGANPPLVGGMALRTRLADRAEVTQMLGVAQAGGWQRTLQTLEQEHRRAMEHGFTQAELDREISEMRARMAAQVSGAATRTSQNLAMSLVEAVNEDRVFAAPATQLALFEEATANLQASAVAAAFRAQFGGTGPLVHLATPQPVENGQAAVLTAFNASRQTAVAAPAVQQARAWPYGNFGAPGQVAERRELPAIGATAIRFANGVRLTVKPTQFRDDEIMVAARFGRGQIGLPTDRATPALGLPLGALTGGGVGELSFEELQQVLAGKVYSADAAVAEDAFVLSGRTRPEDLATQLQLLAAYAREAAWQPTGWNRIRSLGGTLHDQFETTPQGVFARDSAALLRSGDKRWETPSREALAATEIGLLRDVVGSPLANAPLELVVVGDVTVEEAIRQVAATFGALPPRPQTATPAAAPVRFPAGASVTRTHKGRGDQALGFIAWPTAGTYSDLRRTRALSLLSRVFQLRLTDQIREAQGTAYSPNALHSPSDALNDYGYLAAVIEAPPQAMEGFFRDASAIARSLREQPIAADELERARRPLVEAMQRNRSSSNSWWLNQLAGVQQQPARIESISTAVDQMNRVTPADLQQVARQFLADDKAWRLTVVPETR